MSSTSTSLVHLTATRPAAAEAPICILATAVAGIVALASGWYWLGFAAIAPLLFLLPCAAMMAFCMKGTGNGESQCSEKSAAAQVPNGGNVRRQT